MMIRYLLALLFILCAQVSSAREEGVDPTLLSDAQAAMKAKKYAEAAVLYQGYVAQALRETECEAAAEAMIGFRDAVYWSGSGGLLAKVQSDRLWQLVEQNPVCVAPVIAELALTYDLLGKKEACRGLMEEALIRSGGTEEAAVFQRAHDLVVRQKTTELELISLKTPGETRMAQWESARPALINRGDQVLAGLENWHGTQDAAVDIRVGEIAGNLYVRLQVTDDHHITAGAMRDRLTLSIDPNRGHARILGRHTGKVGNAIVVELDTTPNPTPEEIHGLDRAWKVGESLEAGYVVVVCFPKNTLGDVVLEPGNRYAIDVMIQDVDPGGSSTLRWMEMSKDPEVLYWAGVLSVS